MHTMSIGPEIPVGPGSPAPTGPGGPVSPTGPGGPLSMEVFSCVVDANSSETVSDSNLEIF